MKLKVKVRCPDVVRLWNPAVAQYEIFGIAPDGTHFVIGRTS